MPRRFWLAVAMLSVLFVAVLSTIAAAMHRSEITQWLARHDGVAVVVLASVVATIFPLRVTFWMWAVARSARRRR